MNLSVTHMQTCKSCGNEGAGRYCSNCGQSYEIKRISLKSLLHDVFHFFTHLEKGFGYTLQQLITAPGTMQREYVEGIRSRHQKPFSMFFICASVNALGRYGVDELLIRYFHAGSDREAIFHHQYQLLLFIAVIPLLTLLTWPLFRKEKYNYAETGVLQLYSFSFIFLIVTLISLLRFIWPHMDTAFVELPVIAIYSVLTSVNFYHRSNRLATIAKSLAVIILLFLSWQKLEDFVISLINTH